MAAKKKSSAASKTAIVDAEINSTIEKLIELWTLHPEKVQTSVMSLVDAMMSTMHDEVVALSKANARYKKKLTKA